MKTRNVQFNHGVFARQLEIIRRLSRTAGLLAIGVALILAATAAPLLSRQPAPPQDSQSTAIPNVKCVVGLENIKPNARGTLSVLPTGLEFTAGKNKAEITIASIQDIFTGQESRQDVSGPEGTLVKAGIPYGGGRIVSLFSHEVEVLTLEYVDSNGGFHGTIFVLASGKATAVKNQLVAQGAKVGAHVEPPDAKEKP